MQPVLSAAWKYFATVVEETIGKNHKIVHGQLKSEKKSCHKEKCLLVLSREWVHRIMKETPAHFSLGSQLKGVTLKAK